VAFDFEAMLQAVTDGQWSLADINWDASGADTIREEQRSQLKAFMADWVWIEHIGARGFAALARKAPTETIKQLYRYFHAEEQKHANAELALMKRWGMLTDGETPEPNIQVRMAIWMLDHYSDDMPLSALASLIPMLECALDGALVKFLLDEVRDPVCHEVFRHINSDEARHIAVDFRVLDLLGASKAHRLLIESASSLQPQVLLGLLVVFVPLLNKMRDNLAAMGLSETKLHNAVKRYAKMGDRSANTRRIPAYQVFKQQARMVVDRGHPYHRLLADPMVKITNHVPAALLGKPQSWVHELTHEPVAK
jgi:rubrerythrin